MPLEVELRCRCGEVQGRLRDASPTSVNRMICYCDDCQAFVHWLDRADLLDDQGGTDIVQVAPASLSFHRGQDRIAGMRLSEKGLFRFYARCCSTPLGNMAKPSIPFIGVAHGVFRGSDASYEEVFGPPRARVLGKYAVGTNPDSSAVVTARMIAHVVGRMLVWKLRGGSTHPFYDRERGQFRPPIEILTRDERDALRPKCGPTPTA